MLIAVAFVMPGMATMIQDGLYDTGVDANGNSLSADSTDAHYTLDGGGAIVVNGNNFPIPPWIDYSPANGASRWLSVDSGGGNATLPIQDHVYVTTFNLASAADVELSGLFASDNASEAILNGHIIGTISFGTPGNYSFQQYTSFSTANSAYFVTGINTLEFLVHNGDLTQPDGNPGGWFGLRTEDLTITAVPEPTTVAAGVLLILPSCAGAFRIIRNRKLATV